VTTLSEIVVAGLLEALVIMLVALVLVLLINHRLHKKQSCHAAASAQRNNGVLAGKSE
jgi:hypothetical protein